MIKRRLGRGLDALLGGSYAEEDADSSAQALQTVGQDEASVDATRTNLLVSSIDPNPFQPRRTFDPLELAGVGVSAHLPVAGAFVQGPALVVIADLDEDVPAARAVQPVHRE